MSEWLVWLGACLIGALIALSQNDTEAAAVLYVGAAACLLVALTTGNHHVG